MERGTLARKRKGTGESPSTEAREMKEQIQEEVLFKMCAHLRSRKTKGAAQKATQQRGAWEQDSEQAPSEKEETGIRKSIAATQLPVLFFFNVKSLLL